MNVKNKNDFLFNKPELLKPMNIKQSKKYETPLKLQQQSKIAPSSSRSKSSVPSDSQTIVAVCEGRGTAQGIVGLAAINIHHPILILSQIPDGQTYTSTLTKLNIFRPNEILIPASFIETATQNRLFTIVNEKYSEVSVQSIPRNEFNRNRGLQHISSLCAEAFNAVKLIVQDKFYAVSAACALLRYVENFRHVTFTPRSIKIEYQELEDSTMIDIDTANLLNLVAAYKTNTNSKIRPSVLGIIDKCVTNVGRRLLRQSILQPPCRVHEIELRHDCVTELIENPQMLTRLRDVLLPFHSIEKSLVYGTLCPASATSVSEKQLTYTLQLKMHLIALEPLAKELRNTKHPKFREIYDKLSASDKYATILKIIGEVLNEDAQLAKGQAGEMQRCFAIKTGINGFLDVARKLYTEIVDNMRAYVENLSTEYNLPLRAQHTQKMGFHITLPLTHATKNMKATDLPKVFYKIERFAKHFAMTTIEMVSFGKQLKNTSVEIQSISNVLIFKLLTDIRPFIGNLYELCDNVALLDMLVSFALFSSTPGYIRPLFSKTYMLIEEFKHPILEYTSSQEPVTNSVCALEQSNIQIITGPNMSGKTIHVRSLCLIQILSQLGCRVPAIKAIIRPCDHLYAQLANDMTLECGGMSTFTVEMNKFSYLLQTMSNSSFIVLDELCKTTNCEEGFSIAFAICEELAQRKAFAFIVTHYLSLGVLAQIYPNITNWQFEVLENLRANNTRKSLKFTFKKIPGVTEIDAYGIKLARICVNSNSIVDRATELWKWMAPSGKVCNVVNESNTSNFLKVKLLAELNVLKIMGNLTPEIKHSKIQEFKQKTGEDFEIVETVECVTPLENNVDNVENVRMDTNGNTSFSVSQTVVNETSMLGFNSNEFSENITMSAESSFHDPLNHILKTNTNTSTISSNKRKFQDETFINKTYNDSVSFLNESVNKRQKPLVSELYFSSSEDEDENDNISMISLSSTDDQNESFLSIDHQTFIKNIQKGEGVLTSTPVQKTNTPFEKFNESMNAFQSNNYGKFSDKLKPDSKCSEISLSFLSNENSAKQFSTECNSAKSLFSEQSFNFDPNLKKTSSTKRKRNFQPPFKKQNSSDAKSKDEDGGTSSFDVFSQETVILNFSNV